MESTTINNTYRNSKNDKDNATYLNFSIDEIKDIQLQASGDVIVTLISERSSASMPGKYSLTLKNAYALDTVTGAMIRSVGSTMHTMDDFHVELPKDISDIKSDLLTAEAQYDPKRRAEILNVKYNPNEISLTQTSYQDVNGNKLQHNSAAAASNPVIKLHNSIQLVPPRSFNKTQTKQRFVITDKNDIYRIEKNAFYTIERSENHGNSSIDLNYSGNEIKDIQLQSSGDVIVTLVTTSSNNPDKRIQHNLILKNAYTPDTVAGVMIRSVDCIMYTVDGFNIEFPKEISGITGGLITAKAEYDPKYRARVLDVKYNQDEISLTQTSYQDVNGNKLQHNSAAAESDSVIKLHKSIQLIPPGSFNRTQTIQKFVPIKATSSSDNFSQLKNNDAISSAMSALPSQVECNIGQSTYSGISVGKYVATDFVASDSLVHK